MQLDEANERFDRAVAAVQARWPNATFLADPAVVDGLRYATVWLHNVIPGQSSDAGVYLLVEAYEGDDRALFRVAATESTGDHWHKVDWNTGKIVDW